MKNALKIVTLETIPEHWALVQITWLRCAAIAEGNCQDNLKAALNFDTAIPSLLPKKFSSKLGESEILLD